MRRSRHANWTIDLYSVTSADDDDNDDVAVDTGPPQTQLVGVDEPMMEDEIVDKVGACEKLQEMRVMLEQVGVADNVNKNPQNTFNRKQTLLQAHSMP